MRERKGESGGWGESDFLLPLEMNSRHVSVNGMSFRPLQE